MKLRLNLRQSGNEGLTLVEVLVVLAILVILAGMITPPGRAPAKAKRISCVNNLKALGLSMRTFATDHTNQYPMNLAIANGGTREFVTDPAQLWRHWLAITNELSSPKLLVCPSDKLRKAAVSFAPSTNNPTRFVISGNHNLSYFLALSPVEEQPQSILAGDRNVTTNGVPLGPGRHVIWAGTQLGFTEQMHNHSGNLLLGDGSVQQVTDGRFTDQFADALKSTGQTTNVWLVP